jgi:hypothetical protein
LHEEQIGAEDDVPEAVCTEPARHWSARVQEDWFTPFVMLPAGHGAQSRSALSEGAFVT